MSLLLAASTILKQAVNPYYIQFVVDDRYLALK